MTEHELEKAAQIAVDVISDYYAYAFPPEVLDELKSRIFTRLVNKYLTREA